MEKDKRKNIKISNLKFFEWIEKQYNRQIDKNIEATIIRLCKYDKKN